MTDKSRAVKEWLIVLMPNDKVNCATLKLNKLLQQSGVGLGLFPVSLRFNRSKKQRFFSGIGGFALAVRWAGIETTDFVK